MYQGLKGRFLKERGREGVEKSIKGQNASSHSLPRKFPYGEKNPKELNGVKNINAG